MNPNNDTPSIRFAGFTDAWEQRRLASCATFRRGSFPQPYGKKEWYDGDGAMPFVQVADVTDSMNLADDTKQKISKIAQDRSIFAKKGSVLVTLQGSIGRVAITQYEAFIDRTILIFENYRTKTDAQFWAYLIKQKFIDEARSAPGGTIKTITKEALSDFEMNIPEFFEQEKIGLFLSLIDGLITLHQRKYDQLVNIKKSMLEKMFPKNGELVPEVRFAGFTDSWEQRKLGEVSCVRTGFPFDSSEFSEDGEFLVITNGNIQDDNPEVDNLVGNRINVQDSRIKEQYVLNIGDILVTMDGTVGRTAKVTHEQLILAQRVGRLTAKCSSEFLYQSLNTGVFFDAMTTLSHGGTIKHISLSEIADFEFKIPASEAEQIAIGGFFGNIDRLITLHQRKLEWLQNIKKACLEKMFV